MNKTKQQSKLVNKPMAFYCYRTIVKTIRAKKDNARPLPQQLVILPGTYRVHGQTYALTREGLYRFLYPGKSNHQRIVFRKNVAALLSAIAWLQTHGSRDEVKGFPALKKQALTGKLIIKCGGISQVAHRLLTELGIRCRIVGALTLHELNTYDNGHTLMEVRLNNRWSLVDADMSVCFRYRGKRLSLIEAVHQIRKNQYDLEPLAGAAPFSVCCFKESAKEDAYDYGLWMETVFHNQKCLRQWYRRIMMVPKIGDCITVEKASDLATARRYWPECRLLERKEFIRKYYSD